MQRTDQPEPATIKDVARAARVSTATVSAVMDETVFASVQLRGRVAAAISGLDYHPMSAARTLERGPGSLIPLAVPDLSDPFFSRIVRAAWAAIASCKGVMLVLVAATMPPPPRASYAGPPTATTA